ncbi:hypothetical protein [Rothia amarae]|uniref:hypothetical protein n=1 Tax=Rothia amarae TaxID=169480 RepID=UPI0012488365
MRTEFEVNYSCGHSEIRDLSDKRPGERLGFKSFLERGKCKECFVKSATRKNSAETKKFLEQKYQEAVEESRKLELPGLEGSEKQVSWGTSVRLELLQAAYDQLVMGDEAMMSEEEFEEKILVPTRSIGTAKWWLNNREAESEELEELVADVEERDLLSENPFE